MLLAAVYLMHQIWPWAFSSLSVRDDSEVMKVESEDDYDVHSRS